MYIYIWYIYIYIYTYICGIFIWLYNHLETRYINDFYHQTPFAQHLVVHFLDERRSFWTTSART